MKKKCLFCHKIYEAVEIHGIGKRQKYCSKQCRDKQWLKKNPERHKQHIKKWRLKQIVLCRYCGKPIPNDKRGMGVTMCSDECRKNKTKEVNKDFRLKRRTKVLEMLGGPICKYCGCNEVGALEINHINGGGCKELKFSAGSRFISEIYYGKRRVEDLEVTCRVCNAWHYISSKVNKGRWVIKWVEDEKIKKNGDVY
jgi:predicted nucleic acid-binding Zn ribbon protein